jgi:hypothetical protein
LYLLFLPLPSWARMAVDPTCVYTNVEQQIDKIEKVSYMMQLGAA